MHMRGLDAEVTMQGWVLQGCFCEERPAEVRQCGVAFRNPSKLDHNGSFGAKMVANELNIPMNFLSKGLPKLR